MKNFKLLWLLAAACSLTFASCKKDAPEAPDTSKTVTFEAATLPDVGYLNNASYAELGLTFNNNFDAQYQSWFGFAISKRHDLETVGSVNMYSVYANGGAANSVKFAVCCYDTYTTPIPSFFSFAAGVEKKMLSVMVNNGTYAYLAIKDGTDGYGAVTKFKEGDWFKLTMTGYNAAGTQTGVAEYYLADYRNGKTFICSDWTSVDLSPLGKVNKVEITLSSSDVGQWGMNTPAFVCIDNVKFDDPEALTAK